MYWKVNVLTFYQKGYSKEDTNRCIEKFWKIKYINRSKNILM